MFKNYLLPIAAVAVALLMAPTYLERAEASPFIPHALAAAAPASDVQPVYWRRGYYGGWHRGYGWRRGYYGGWRIGAPYYGGIWYGPRRHWYGGRWWPYGVGTCWRPAPMGYVWVCG